MTYADSYAWQWFVLVSENFIGNRNADNWQELVADMSSKFKDLDAERRIKIQYILSHLDGFPENIGDQSEERGKWLHHDLKIMEQS